MRTTIRLNWFFLLVFLPLSAFYLCGISKVPFHPDESTLIFMSTDFEQILTNPLAMSWTPDTPESTISRYRMLDAPLTRYLLGLGTSLFARPALPADWDWSGTWEENQQSGALPNDRTLLTARLTLAILFPLSLFILYRIGIYLESRLLGVIIVLIIGSNALILLHTRRAMAEAVLLFTVLIALYSFIHADKRPLFTGLAVALAFNAKHSAIFLFPLGLLAVCWIQNQKSRALSRILINSAQFLIGFILITVLLNPFLWRYPLSAMQEALFQRQDLLTRQIADVQRQAPGQVLETPTERAAVLLAQLFITPTMFSEVGNYRSDTSQSETIYLQLSGHQLWRKPVAGGALLGLTLLGVIAALRASFSPNTSRRRILFLYIISFGALATGLILIVPLPWQRYVVPLIPLVSIFIGYGLVWGIKTSRKIFSHGMLSSRLSQILTQFSPNSWMS